MAAYYNEIDPFAAQWLRNLIAAGHIADGVVDCRSIEEIEPNDLKDFTQCHFFAGIGVWSHALRLAGWPDERPVWTGSCPCQPFSSAGKAGGFTDERHLWPAFFHLIEECRPAVVFGEQVASKDGLAWLDLVHADLEGARYAVGAADLCAAGVGAPHIRQRLYWVADSVDQRCHGEHALLWPEKGGRLQAGTPEVTGCGQVDGMGDPNNKGLERLRGRHQASGGRFGAIRSTTSTSESNGVAYADGKHSDTWGCGAGANSGQQAESPKLSRGDSAFYRCGPTNGFWRDADWLGCRDGKWRPVEPGTCPLAHGVAGRVGRLRAYGNAINAYQAEAFITAYMEALQC